LIDDARGVEADRVADGVVDHERPRLVRRRDGVDVRRVGAQDERGLVAAGVALEQVGLADGELDRVRLGVDEHVDRPVHVLDPGEHRGLPGHPVVDRDVEAAFETGWKRRLRRYCFTTAGTLVICRC
jgi:hypothetical protein